MRSRKEGSIMILKIMGKVVAIPMVILFSVLYYMLYGASNLYCRVAGTAYTLLGIFAILAIITQQWIALVIFGILAAAGFIVILLAGHMLGVLDCAKEYFGSVLHA